MPHEVESKIASWISAIFEHSFVVMFIIFAVLVGFALIINGEYEKLLTMNSLKILIMSSFYALSIYLLYLLPAKPYKFRRITWCYSFLFHCFLLMYLAFWLEIGILTFIIGAVEIVVFLLSLVGLYYCVSKSTDKYA